MTFPNENPKLPENINNSYESPLVDFLSMAAVLLGVILILTFAIGWSASWVGPQIPRNWEPDISLANTGLSEEDLRIEVYLQNLLMQLTARDTSAQDTTTGDTTAEPIALTLHYLPEVDVANAFATAGGNIHVTAGLLRAVESENGLAMVLAHEYAHIELRHPAILMLEQLGHTLLYAFLGLGETGAGAFAQSTGMATLMSFSRDMERSADLRASELLTTHYGHTAGASELFRHLLEEDEVEEGRATSSWGLWQSHPDTQERIERLESSVGNRHKKGGEADALRPLPDWLITMLEQNPSE